MILHIFSSTESFEKRHESGATFPLRRALQGLEQEEELYTEADLKVRWQ